jgi:hypothetical protein
VQRFGNAFARASSLDGGPLPGPAKTSPGVALRDNICCILLPSKRVVQLAKRMSVNASEQADF